MGLVAKKTQSRLNWIVSDSFGVLALVTRVTELHTLLRQLKLMFFAVVHRCFVDWRVTSQAVASGYRSMDISLLSQRPVAQGGNTGFRQWFESRVWQLSACLLSLSSRGQ